MMRNGKLNVSDPFGTLKPNHRWLSQMAKLGFLLMMGASMSAEAGLFGFGGTNWKEEVLLHDGSKIIVKRSQSYGGRHEIGHSGTVKEQEITFAVPLTNKPLTFKNEYSEDIGTRNFYLLALHILKNVSYIIAEPNRCLSYNKWGRPNPPYVVFKHNGMEWQRIPLMELPREFKEINLLINTGGHDEEKAIAAQPIVPADLVRKLNGSLGQGIYPQYKAILREPYSGAEQCSEMIFGGKDSGWHGVGLFGKTYEACMQYCKREKVDSQYCPCETLFKGKK